MKAVTPFINVILPKFIIDEMVYGRDIQRLISLIIGMVSANVILQVVGQLMNYFVSIANKNMLNQFEIHFADICMHLNYERIEDAQTLNLKEQAIFPIVSQNAMRRMIDSIASIIQSLFQLIGLFILLVTANVFIVLALIALIVLQILVNQKTRKKELESSASLIPVNRDLGYYGRIIDDFDMAKDVRLYHMKPLILRKFNQANRRILHIIRDYMLIEEKSTGVNRIIVALQQGISYAYFIFGVIRNWYSIGDFTMYLNAANTFSTTLSAFFDQILNIRQMCSYLEKYIEFEELGRRDMESGAVSLSELKDTAELQTIEFSHVWFRYPHSDEYALKDINIVIPKGENLSIVGPNGSGKTTFIKLLCRLYRPERGVIRINGVDIQEYGQEQYRKVLAVVFQDYKLFATTIRDNVELQNQRKTSPSSTDCLDRAGVMQKIALLPKGIDTPLYRIFTQEGVDLSGGEKQKLAIARAIYTDAPALILDEPTAALDLYAEYSLYKQIREISSHKTTIFISHRLSSSLFCDKIAVFDRGEMVEYGTHDELLNRKALYASLWKAQAQYYL